MSSNHFGIFALKSESDTDSSMNSLKQSNKNKNDYSSKQSSTCASFSSGEEQQSSIDPQICRIPTLFEWNGKNDTVFLTGSFCNWKQKFQMPKITENLFQITLALPKGIYYYKFVVDGEWNYSRNKEFTTEQGITNNIIDTTKVVIEQHKNNSNNNSNKKSVMLKTPVPCPDSYKNNIRNIQSVMLNHSLVRYNKNKRITVVSSSYRIRQKNVIFIYYKPSRA